MPVTAAIIAGAGAAIQLGTSAVQNYKAKKIAKANIRPEYVPNPQIQQNVDLTASMAGQGLSDASQTLYTQQNERNLSQSLDAILRGGGSVNQISDLYSNNQDAMLKLASLDSELQFKNIQAFLNANKDLAQETQSAWNINEYSPYVNNAQLSAKLKQDAVANFSGGLNTAMSGASNYFTGTMYKDENKKLIEVLKGNKGADYDNISGALGNSYDVLTKTLIEQKINEAKGGDYDNIMESYNSAWMKN